MAVMKQTPRQIGWRIALGLLLALLSWAIWQARFEAVPHSLDGPVAFEGSERTWQHSGNVSTSQQGEMRLTREADAPVATLDLGRLDDARFVQIEVDVRWQNVTKAEPLWASARVILSPTDEEGKTVFGLDHGLFAGFGSSDWHRHEGVFELRPEWEKVRFSADLYAQTGEMTLRNMEIHLVKQRPWIPTATIALLVCWSAWLTTWLIQIRKPWPILRSFACAIAILAAWWFAVWPQMKMLSLPVGTPFWIGDKVTAHSPERPTHPAPSPSTLPENPLPTAGIPVATAPAGATSTTQNEITQNAPPAAVPAPSPEKRTTPKITDWFRGLDLEFSPVHFVFFFLFTLGAFALAGHTAALRWACLIAIASEIIPDWIGDWQLLDWEDVSDLSANLAGIALAFLAWKLLRRIALQTKWLHWVVAQEPHANAYTGDAGIS